MCDVLVGMNCAWLVCAAGSYLVLVDSFQNTKNRGKGGGRGGKEDRELEERNMRRLMNQVQMYERHEISFFSGLEYNYGANWSTVLLCIL